MPLKTIRPRLKTLDTRTAKPAPRTYASRVAAEPFQAFYSTSAWRELRERLFMQRGRKCEDCGRTGTRIYADHVVELQDGGAPTEESNIRLRCGSCHTAKTADSRARRMGLR